MHAHVRLKNAITEDEKYHILMTLAFSQLTEEITGTGLVSFPILPSWISETCDLLTASKYEMVLPTRGGAGS